MSKTTRVNRRRRGGDSHEAVEFFTRPKRSLPAVLIFTAWRWRWELIVSITVLVVHHRLVRPGLSNTVAAIVMGALLSVVLAIPHSRRFARNRFWCVVVRHRLRVCMNEMRTLNYSGNAALILAAYGTREGEAVWLWMRPGLSITDLEKRQEAIVAACWARDSRVTRSRRFAALVRIDVLRRDPLGRAHIESLLLSATRDMPSTQLAGDRALHLVRNTIASTGTDTTASPDSGTAAVVGAATKKSPKPAATSAIPVPVVLRNGEDVSEYV